MCSKQVNTASAYFNDNWQRYQNSVKNNTLYHQEMFAALDNFLNLNMKKPFSFVDVGCGDSSAVAPILLNKTITKYIGIDEAKDVLKMSAANLDALNFEKEFIADNMITAISEVKAPVDIIFTSYAVHHLNVEQKTNFIAECKQKLHEDGFLLMVDCTLAESQTRDEWLAALKNRMKATIPHDNLDEIDIRMQHPSDADFPESINTFANIAQQQAWKSFQVIVDKGIFSFMVFAK